jgi:hypothetical protein
MPRTLATGILACISLTLPANAWARQDQPRITQPSTTPVPCCPCADGSRRLVSLNTGYAAWRVRLLGQTNTGPVIVMNDPAWVVMPPSQPPPQWIRPAGNPTDSNTTYIYELNFTVYPCAATGRVSVSGTFAADNTGKIRLDSTLLAVSPGYFSSQIRAFSAANIGLGMHTLSVEVYNSSVITGMVLRGLIGLACPTGPIGPRSRARPHPAEPTRPGA